MVWYPCVPLKHPVLHIKTRPTTYTQCVVFIPRCGSFSLWYWQGNGRQPELSLRMVWLQVNHHKLTPEGHGMYCARWGMRAAFRIVGSFEPTTLCWVLSVRGYVQSDIPFPLESCGYHSVVPRPERTSAIGKAGARESPSYPKPEQIRHVIGCSSAIRAFT